MSIGGYGLDRDSNSAKAKEHTELMARKYKEEIDDAVNETITYFTDFYYKKAARNGKRRIHIDDMNTELAALKYRCGEKRALLNFASYENPGGCFLEGSMAQEECLCHTSFLYNVLSDFKVDFYAWNNKNKNQALYFNRALYTPNVIFEQFNETVEYDVITCAAPNKEAAQKYYGVSDIANEQALRERIKFVLDIAEYNRVNTLILGAYGCGVFGQDPYEVAKIFRYYLKTIHRGFDDVIFAIPDTVNKRNLRVFKDVFIGEL